MESLKKRTRKVEQKSPYRIVKLNLKRLSYTELEQILELAMRYRKEKMGNEELRLMREKEELEMKIKDLKALDKKLNDI